MTYKLNRDIQHPRCIIMAARTILLSLLAFGLLMSGSVIMISAAVDGDGPRPNGPPSRTIVQETESNNGWPSANKLPNDYGTYELHGNITTNNDFDYFYFNLQGGSGPVDEVTVTPTFFNNTYGDYLVGWFWAFYPDNSLSPPDIDDLSMNLEMWDNLYYWNRLTIRATYTGNYGFIVRPAFGTTSVFLYNLTITVSSVTPSDPRNDQASSSDLSSNTVVYSDRLDTALDMFDWYHLTAPNTLHPTVLDLTTTLTNPNPDQNDGTRDIGVEVDIKVFFNSRSDQTTFNSQKYRVSTRPIFQQYGCSASPFNLKLEKNCTEMYIAYYIESYVKDNGGSKTYMTGSGSTTYTADFKVKANIPNNRPTITNGGVSPQKGRTQDPFTFSVTYYDMNNETPRQIWVWLDGKPFRTLSPAPGAGSDMRLGVRYQVEVPGSIIGKDKVHNFNFSAQDLRGDWAFQYPNGLSMFNGPVVDDNQAPASWGDLKTFDLLEDREPLWLDLDKLFSDKDLADVLTFTILDQTGKWSSARTDGNLTARIIDNSTVPPSAWKLKVTFKENVNGKVKVRLNATDNAFIPKYAEMDLIFNIAPVNDPPMITRINSVPTEELVPIRKSQGDRVEVRVQASDPDTTDVLTYEWDIGAVLKEAKAGMNYGIDPTNGDLWFVTSDGDVPSLTTTLKVTDGKGGKDEVAVEVLLDNVNDPPKITVPAFRSTIEGEVLTIVPTYSDPDLRSGDELLIFFYDAGALTTNAPPNSVEFSDSTGRLVIKAISEKMNGEWDVNISVIDRAGLSAFGICKVRIDNINDVPQLGMINFIQQENNLTVTFYTDDPKDEDIEDLHTFIWEFGDGSVPLSGIDMKRVEHNFPDAGAFKVTLTVHDGTVSSKEVSVVITVQAPPPDPDLDDDMIEDWWEVRFGFSITDPNDALEDPDKDGLTNLQEFDHYISNGGLLNPKNPDTDGDGYKDGYELEYGSDPLDIEDFPVDNDLPLGNVLWVLFVLMVVLSLLMLVIFAVLKLRNRQKAVALPALDPAQMQYFRQMGMQESYQQLPPPQLQALPPAAPQYSGEQYSPGYPGTDQIVQSGPLTYPTSDLDPVPPVQTGPETPQADQQYYSYDAPVPITSPGSGWDAQPPSPSGTPVLEGPSLVSGGVAPPIANEGEDMTADLPEIPAPPEI
ncbi:MAG: PKD domain-containing protein [Candidatus Thermoplasmatota archaeon]|nr:PKD domain-containing protein [Candidatus Thermoplasmatota archaeon]